MAVTETVSEAVETPVTELPPLSRVIDPDALNRLVSHAESSEPPELTIAFEYTGLTVVVHASGMVYTTPIDDRGDIDDDNARNQ